MEYSRYFHTVHNSETIPFHLPNTIVSCSEGLKPAQLSFPPFIMSSAGLKLPAYNYPLHLDPWLLGSQCNSLSSYEHVQDAFPKNCFQMESYSTVISNLTSDNQIYHSSARPSNKTSFHSPPHTATRHEMSQTHPSIVTPSLSYVHSYDDCEKLPPLKSHLTYPSQFKYILGSHLSEEQSYTYPQQFHSPPPKSIHFSLEAKNISEKAEEAFKSKRTSPKLNAKPYTLNNSRYKCVARTVVTSLVSKSEEKTQETCPKFTPPLKSPKLQHSSRDDLIKKKEICKVTVKSACSQKDNSSPKLALPSPSPQFPVYFTKGSIIQLASGKLKNVETLTTEDFTESASQNSEVSIDSSTITKIEILSSRTANLAFCVGKEKVQVTIEAALEHPFFVFNQGWSSCSPEQTMFQYRLPCRKLSIGDVCISLTHKKSSLPDQVSELLKNVAI